jgi:hypothetical protein
VNQQPANIVACPACDAWMPRGGVCPDCRHEDRPDCECPWCEQRYADYGLNFDDEQE